MAPAGASTRGAVTASNGSLVIPGSFAVPRNMTSSVRAETCDRLRKDAPVELVEACRRSDFGASVQRPEVSLDGVAACVEPCDPEHTCGKVLTSCSSPGAVSALRCDVTHIFLKTRQGGFATGPHSAPYRVFVVSIPGCLRRTDDGGFADDAASLRLLMTFPEKFLLGESSITSVAFPLSWRLALTTKGTGGFLVPGFRLPPSADRKVPVVSVFRSSRAHQENGFRVTTLSALANRLHIASAREPARKDRIPSDALYSAQLVEMTFTVMCRAGGAGVGAIILKTLAPGAEQKGKAIGEEDGGDGLGAKRVLSAAAAAAAALSDKSPSVRWTVGRDVPSPVSGQRVGGLRVAWLCLTVDTWTGRITDCREVLIGDKGTSVSRIRNTGVIVDLSADLMINVVGLGGVGLGIGRAEHNIFGMSNLPQASLVD